MALPSFNNPFMLGFDNLEQLLGQISKTAETFPPYNIEQVGDNALRLSLAVAGYKESDLDITLEDSQLIIKGRQEQDPARQFLHRGIAGRAFVKTFVLADNMLVGDVYMENGLLNVELLRPSKAPKVMKINIQKTKCERSLVSCAKPAKVGKSGGKE